MSLLSYLGVRVADVGLALPSENGEAPKPASTSGKDEAPAAEDQTIGFVQALKLPSVLNYAVVGVMHFALDI